MTRRLKDAASFDGYDLPIAAVLQAYSDWNVRQGQHAEAESLERRIAQIRERHIGPANPALSPYLRRLAAGLRAEARTELAEPILLRSLSIGKKPMAPMRPNSFPIWTALWLYISR